MAEVDGRTGSGAGLPVRILAGLGGGLLLLVTGLVTVGGAVIATAAVFLSFWLAHRRGRPFGRGRAWLFASAAASIFLLLLVGLGFALMSGEERTAILSPSAATDDAPQPPAWLERFLPDPDEQEAVTGLSRPVAIYAGIMGGIFAVLVFGALVGTLGWLAALLLVIAARGAWPRTPRAAASPDADLLIS
jgi:hypothetical protein